MQFYINDNAIKGMTLACDIKCSFSHVLTGIKIT